MKSAAFFDIDGTLVRCLTQKELLRVFLKKGLLSTAEALIIFFWFCLYKVGLVQDSTRIREYAYQFLRGKSMIIIEGLIQKIYDEKIRHMFSQVVLKRLEIHKKNGDKIFCNFWNA